MGRMGTGLVSHGERGIGSELALSRPSVGRARRSGRLVCFGPFLTQSGPRAAPAARKTLRISIRVLVNQSDGDESAKALVGR